MEPAATDWSIRFPTSTLTPSRRVELLVATAAGRMPATAGAVTMRTIGTGTDFAIPSTAIIIAAVVMTMNVIILLLEGTSIMAKIGAGAQITTTARKTAVVVMSGLESVAKARTPALAPRAAP